MAYVVFDLEYNNMQGLFEELDNYVPHNQSNERHLYPNEIIQIGAVKLNDNFEVIGEFNRYIKNYFYKNLNPAITEITGITQSQMESGVSFVEAFKEFYKFCKGEVIMTWGNSDIYELIRNCHMHRLPITVIGKRYLDLQQYVGKKDFEDKVPSLKNALIYFNIESDDEKLHDGLYDAICTAKVLKAVVLKHGNISHFKNTRVLFSSDSIYITNIRVRDIPDEEVTVCCPLCDGEISYDVSMNNEHGKIRSFYHCNSCSSSFIEDISVKENMTGSRKYFKKIKKISRQHYDMIVNGKQIKRANNL